MPFECAEITARSGHVAPNSAELETLKNRLRRSYAMGTVVTRGDGDASEPSCSDDEEDGDFYLVRAASTGGDAYRGALSGTGDPPNLRLLAPRGAAT